MYSAAHILGVSGDEIYLASHGVNRGIPGFTDPDVLSQQPRPAQSSSYWIERKQYVFMHRVMHRREGQKENAKPGIRRCPRKRFIHMPHPESRSYVGAGIIGLLLNTKLKMP